ncbi:MAG: hypothetical protein ABI193_03815 [Minicystis sp.]
MSEASNAAPGEWRRPEPGEHRSPCPALNALANSGYLPRDGRVTRTQLVEALESRLGLARVIGAGLADAALRELGKPGPDGETVLDLADLGKHGFIEHDASLTRRDAECGDALELVKPLLDQLLSLSKDGKTLTREDLTVAHQLRLAQTEAAGRSASIKAGVLGTAEASLLFLLLEQDGAVSIADAIEFLQEERLPARLPARKLGPLTLGATMAAMTVEGNLPVFEAARRAKKAEQEVAEPAAAGCPIDHGARSKSG